MKKKRLFIRILVCTLLAVLLIGCSDSQDIPFTTAGMTEGTAISTTETLVGGGDFPIYCHYFFESYDEFQDFYAEFSTANTAPIVAIAWEDVEKSERLVYYTFGGGILMRTETLTYQYDRKFPEAEFTFDAYFSSITKREATTNDEWDYAITGISYVLDQPLKSLHGVEIRPRDNWDIQMSLNPQEFLGEKRYFDIYLNDTLLMSFTSMVAVENADYLHEEMCQMVLDRLVCMSGE